MVKDKETRTMLHNHEQKDNERFEGLCNEISELTVFKMRLQGICRKVGWILLSTSVFVGFFDYIAQFLIGTNIFSFTYSEGWGLGQILTMIASGGLGLILVIVGYYKS